jgi:hypothetical protein
MKITKNQHPASQFFFFLAFFTFPRHAKCCNWLQKSRNPQIEKQTCWSWSTTDIIIFQTFLPINLNFLMILWFNYNQSSIISNLVGVYSKYWLLSSFQDLWGLFLVDELKKIHKPKKYDYDEKRRYIVDPIHQTSAREAVKGC